MSVTSARLRGTRRRPDFEAVSESNFMSTPTAEVDQNVSRGQGSARNLSLMIGFDRPLTFVGAVLQS